MLKALVNGLNVLASPKMRGLCPYCKSDVTSVCGDFKMNHWRHLSTENCDSWSEGETEWHRAWKSEFPETWQEIIFKDELSNEKHIADIFTDKGIVFEFQNSPIDAQEVIIRTQFYKNIVWVVNGINHWGTVRIGLGHMESNLCEFKIYGRLKLFHRWSVCTAPVFFDFGQPYMFWLKSFDPLTNEGFFQLFEKEYFLQKALGRITG